MAEVDVVIATVAELQGSGMVDLLLRFQLLRRYGKFKGSGPLGRHSRCSDFVTVPDQVASRNDYLETDPL